MEDKLFADRKYNIISMIIAFLACVPFFIGFGRGKPVVGKLVIAVMTAISVVGRIIFAPVPGFKPVTELVKTRCVIGFLFSVCGHLPDPMLYFCFFVQNRFWKNSIG